MSFKDMVKEDNKSVFLNTSEMAELHTVEYDGTTYEDVSIVMSGIKEKDRKQSVSDHVKGLYLVTTVAHFSKEDLKDVVPEKGMRIKISDDDYMRLFYVASSTCKMGMVRLELEAVDE
jgi:hypothetical protein